MWRSPFSKLTRNLVLLASGSPFLLQDIVGRGTAFASQLRIPDLKISKATPETDLFLKTWTLQVSIAQCRVRTLSRGFVYDVRRAAYLQAQHCLSFACLVLCLADQFGTVVFPSDSVDHYARVENLENKKGCYLAWNFS